MRQATSAWLFPRRLNIIVTIRAASSTRNAAGKQPMIRLSAFADEISQNPVEQVDVLSGHGIKFIEFRAIHGINVLTSPKASMPTFATFCGLADLG